MTKHGVSVLGWAGKDKNHILAMEASSHDECVSALLVATQNDHVLAVEARKQGECVSAQIGLVT
jgi:hypothetical protein